MTWFAGAALLVSSDGAMYERMLVHFLEIPLGLLKVTLLAQDLALGDFGLAAFLRPGPDPVADLLVWIHVVQLELLDRTTLHALLSGEELVTSLTHPVPLVLTLHCFVTVRHRHTVTFLAHLLVDLELRRHGSNVGSWLQRPVCYQLHHPGMGVERLTLVRYWHNRRGASTHAAFVPSVYPWCPLSSRSLSALNGERSYDSTYGIHQSRL